jgi:hypothetical protein
LSFLILTFKLYIFLTTYTYTNEEQKNHCE